MLIYESMSSTNLLENTRTHARLTITVKTQDILQATKPLIYDQFRKRKAPELFSII